MRYPLSPNPVFRTLQGEGHLRGFPMVFLRLGGCSVGCAECDTNYSVDSRASAEEITKRVSEQMPAGDRDKWVCITGGEPTDHDILPILKALKGAGFSTMLISSGVRRVIPPVDWLSISPHYIESAKLRQRYGNEIKLVDGLNGLDLNEWIKQNPDESTDFFYRYVQPLWKDGGECPESMARCLAFLKQHHNWALSRQDHKLWGVP